MKSIFVVIAAYRDPELSSTVRNLVDSSSGRFFIHLSIHTQGPESDEYDFSDLANKPNIRVTHKHSLPPGSHGVGWARSVGQQAYDGEDYYLQIDSHVQMIADWDRVIVDQLSAVTTQGDAILTAYLPGFKFEDGVRTVAHQLPTRFRVIRDNGLLKATSEFIPPGNQPVETLWFAGGFAFSTGSFVSRVPYDPEIFFQGEEITMAIRAYTAGFRLYCPSVFVGAHLYKSKTAASDSTNKPHRFWDKEDEFNRGIKWHHRDSSSKIKVDAICRGEWFGVFGIQDLDSYREFHERFKAMFGIDVRYRLVPAHGKARNEPQGIQAESIAPSGLESRDGRRGQLTVVGVGIKAIAQMTVEAIAQIKAADIVFYNPTSPVMSAMLKKLNRNCFNLRRFYGEDKYRQITYIQMADVLLREVQNNRKVVAVFHGHPGFFVSAARRAMWQVQMQGYKARMLPGVSSLDNLCADLGVDPGALGLQVVKAGRLLSGKTRLCFNEHVVIVQPGAVGDHKFSFRKMKNTRTTEMLGVIEAVYGSEHEIAIYRAASIPGQHAAVLIKRLSELTSGKAAVQLTGASIYIPPKGMSYTQILEFQSAATSRPRSAFGKAIYTPPLEMAPAPDGFEDVAASPALLAVMERISNDAEELAAFERGPREYLARSMTLAQTENSLFD
jgi:precorrin-2 methylase